MSTHKYVDLICVAVLVCTVLLTVLFMNGSRLGIETIVDGDSANSSDSAWFTRNDRDAAWSDSDAARITLAGDHARIAGAGAYVYDGDVIIAQPGRYLVSGTLDDGSIVVDADARAKVWIRLDGADISCSDDACLRVNQADKVFLTLAEGSENSMSSGAEYSEEAVADKRSGAIFSRDDLTVNGSGSLRVLSSYRHGIDVNDDLVITGGTISVEAPGDAIRANDSLRVENAALSLKAGDEGIDVSHADSVLYIASGSFEIESTGAGMKCASDILLEDGAFHIRTQADGIHAGGSFAMTDGAVRIDSGDDGIHADRAAAISGGSLTVSECYEGIEALTIDISGGSITLYPSDDGLNANGGSDFFGPPGMFAQQEETAAEDEETWVHISGGSLTIVNNVARDADGIDSNGDILISGGSVRISLSAGGSNSAIDYGSESGGVCEISGGDVVACGSYMMAEGFSSGSSQCSVLYNISYGVAAGTELYLEDAEGRVLLRYTPPCTFSSVSLSSPEMKIGETYTLVIGEKEEQITLNEVSASYGDVKSEGFGGNMNFGRMHQRDEMPRGERPTSSDLSPRPGMDGAPPDFADMPAPPDWGGEIPDGFNPPSPTDLNGGQKPGQIQAPQEAEDEALEEAPTGPQPVSLNTWIMLGACLLVLLLGIAYAVFYRR